MRTMEAKPSSIDAAGLDTQGHETWKKVQTTGPTAAQLPPRDLCDEINLLSACTNFVPQKAIHFIQSLKPKPQITHWRQLSAQI